MRLGILTSPFSRSQDWPLERIIAWAGESGIDCLEIERRHLDLEAMLQPGPREALQSALAAARVSVSAISVYSMDLTSPDPAARARMVRSLEQAIDAAAALGVRVVCTLTGGPVAGKSKLDTIREDLPALLTPLIERASAKGVRIALENFSRTCIQDLDHWRALFAALPQPELGLNFDPSHLDQFGIDHLAALQEFAPRVFHAHAKDVVVDQASGAARFALPGCGRIAWAPFVARLRAIGFDGAVAIEHEDPLLSPVDGFRLGVAHLRPLIA